MCILLSTKKNGSHLLNPQFLSLLDGGFNPFEKYEAKLESSPNRDENKKYVKPPPSLYI